MISMENFKGRSKLKRILRAGTVLVLFLALAYGALYALGYSISSELKIERNGILKLHLDSPGAKIFIDGGKGKVASGRSISWKHLSETVHSVIVSKDEYWPWAKTVDIKKGSTVTYYPFFIKKNQDGEIVTPADPEYEKLMALAREAKPPTKFSPLFSEDKKIGVWLEDGTIYAAWYGEPGDIREIFCAPECSARIEVLKTGGTVTNVSFLKNRDFVIVYGDGSGLYAIELDRRGMANFMPIYQGRGISYFQANDKSFYLIDGGNLLHIDP